MTVQNRADESPGGAVSAELSWTKDFTFEGMKKEEFGRYYRFRAAAAREIAEALAGGSRLVFRAATGAGKTIIAMMAQSLLGWRTLFLAPSKVLLAQHRAFLIHEMGYRFASRLIDGDTPQSGRIWGNEDERYVFATPEVVLSELSRGIDVLAKFQLVILDEGHHSRGKEPYVVLGRILREKRVAYFGMSATLGGDERDIGELIATMRYDREFWYSVAMPFRHEDYVFLPLSPEQQRTEEGGFRPLEKRLRDGLMKMLVHARVRMPPLRDGPLHAGDLDRITYEFESLSGDLRASALFRLAAYKKLLYAYRVFLTESYETFLTYVGSLRARARTSDKYLLADATFRRIIATAEQYRGNHPKVLCLRKEVTRQARHGKRSIVFFGDKITASHMADILSHDGIHAAAIFGASGMERKKQLETMEKFRSGELLALMATSVIEEGVSVPEVALVVNYHMPQEPKSRLQRAGRTARMAPGSVLHLIMDHVFDLTTFYGVHRKVRELEDDERAFASGEKRLQIQYPLFD